MIKSAMPYLGISLITLAAVASAQPVPDHLKCHRVRDPQRVRAVVTLDALQTEFSDPGCTLGKPKLFCVPVVNSDTYPLPTGPDITGQPVEDDYICYRLTCPKRPPDREVMDRFGTRIETKFVSSLLCVPAKKGPLVTTSTTTSTSTTSTSTSSTSSSSTSTSTSSSTTSTLGCGQTMFPACDGPCAPGEACVGMSGACVCLMVGGCGQVMGPPECYGICPPETPICRFDGMSCLCDVGP
jgi:hypothetical protein